MCASSLPQHFSHPIHSVFRYILSCSVPSILLSAHLCNIKSRNNHVCISVYLSVVAWEDALDTIELACPPVLGRIGPLDKFNTVTRRERQVALSLRLVVEDSRAVEFGGDRRLRLERRGRRRGLLSCNSGRSACRRRVGGWRCGNSIRRTNRLLAIQSRLGPNGRLGRQTCPTARLLEKLGYTSMGCSRPEINSPVEAIRWVMLRLSSCSATSPCCSR